MSDQDDPNRPDQPRDPSQEPDPEIALGDPYFPFEPEGASGAQGYEQQGHEGQGAYEQSQGDLGQAYDPTSGLGGGYDPYGAPVPAPVATKRGGRGKTIAATVIALALIAGAGAAVVLTRAQDKSSLEDVVPASTGMFAKVSLEPSADQARALRRLADRLPESQRTAIPDRLDDILQSLLDSQGINYRADVKPWLGAEAGIAISLPPMDGNIPAGEPEVVALLLSEDDAAARAALAKRRGDVEVDVTDGVAYIAETRAIIDKAKAAREASRTLNTNPRFTSEAASLTDSLAYLWVDPEAIRAIGTAFSQRGGGAPVPTGFASGGASVAIRAEDEGIVLSGRAEGPPGQEAGASGVPALAENAPSSTLAALTFFDLGGGLQKALEGLATFGAGTLPGFEGAGDPLAAVREPLRQFGINLERDLVPWLRGELSVVVGGITPNAAEVAVLIESTDDAAAARTFSALIRNLPAIAQSLDFGVRETSSGFVLEFRNGASLVARRTRGRVVFATTEAYADRLLTANADSLANDTIYRRAVGGSSEGTGFQLYVRIDRIRALLDGLLPSASRGEYDRNVAPFIAPFEAFIMRGSQKDGVAEFRVALTIPQG